MCFPHSCMLMVTNVTGWAIWAWTTEVPLSYLAGFLCDRYIFLLSNHPSNNKQRRAGQWACAAASVLTSSGCAALGLAWHHQPARSHLGLSSIWTGKPTLRDGRNLINLEWFRADCLEPGDETAHSESLHQDPEPVLSGRPPPLFLVWKLCAVSEGPVNCLCLSLQ